MNLNSNVWILSKSFFKWTWRKRFYSSAATPLKVPNISENLSSFKKLKYPESMFVYCNDVAKDISDTISVHLTKKYGKKKIEIIEANPGPCLITQHLLKKTNYNICVYENNYVFKEYLMAVHSNYGDRIKINHGNFLLLWKFGFQDRMDRGDRVSKFLSSIGTPQQPWNQERPSLKIIASLPNKKFMNYLIYSFIFQTGLMVYGRPEFYFLLSPSVFKRYSCKPIIDKKYYKTQTILFQTIFDIESLKTYPRTAFFPPHISKSASKNGKNVRYKELKEADDKYMILAKVVGRREILNSEGLTEDLLKPYWYFVKHHTLSRKNFVIPMLEQWIPGCGPYFIAQGYTIFTQFGDLTPPQILRLFLKFISLPEYNDSPFLNSMESRIAKLLPSLQIPPDDSITELSENNSSIDFEDFNNKDN
ncbi:dimethyladenosine transferase 2, mitochondrial [Myzus persicae]|uniref:dimethyladenosine transferase 2, mitochondrial n=1 Tax=Myzus persicae TaxID=13164 RepID=UPI000B935363|nr:dimethyladenosine transferase 2, mitochondrial [Myzus persicae]XP_022182824.1 dimethyladenosine transferase 2, mitochondrial [Myzus persicae]XP_022182830.1 dimethyladenosine transferase 2, mitochondrial [Myzus persicae]